MGWFAGSGPPFFKLVRYFNEDGDANCTCVHPENADQLVNLHYLFFGRAVLKCIFYVDPQSGFVEMSSSGIYCDIDKFLHFWFEYTVRPWNGREVQIGLEKMWVRPIKTTFANQLMKKSVRSYFSDNIDASLGQLVTYSVALAENVVLVTHIFPDKDTLDAFEKTMKPQRESN